jgi:hypothetical protein
MEITQHVEVDEAAYDFETIKSSFAVGHAKLQGLDIVVPRGDELLIDIDSPEGMAVFNKNITKFATHLNNNTVPSKLVTQSKSGNPDKQHITLTLKEDLTPTERILFQLFLGSDPTRELLSYIRLINDDPIPTLFYEKRRNLLPAAPEPVLLSDGNKEK